MKTLKIFLSVMLLISLSIMVSAETPKRWSPDADAFKTAAGCIEELYRAVTFEANAAPDWELLKTTFFLEDTVIVLRTGRDKMSVMSRDGFVKLFIHDIEKYKLDQTGFQETLVSKKLTVFGNIAHALTVYDAYIPGSPRKQRGVDSFQLLKKDGRWWIVSIVNEVPSPNNPVPKEFFK